MFRISPNTTLSEEMFRFLVNDASSIINVIIVSRRVQLVVVNIAQASVVVVVDAARLAADQRGAQISGDGNDGDDENTTEMTCNRVGISCKR